MNDITSSTPTASAPAASPTPEPAAPPSSTPSTHSKTSTEDLELLAREVGGDGDISSFVEQQEEDENPDLTEQQRRFNRHQRKNAKIAALQAENAKLKARSEGRLEPGEEEM